MFTIYWILEATEECYNMIPFFEKEESLFVFMCMSLAWRVEGNIPAISIDFFTGWDYKGIWGKYNASLFISILFNLFQKDEVEFHDQTAPSTLAHPGDLREKTKQFPISPQIHPEHHLTAFKTVKLTQMHLRFSEDTTILYIIQII